MSLIQEALTKPPEIWQDRLSRSLDRGSQLSLGIELPALGPAKSTRELYLKRLSDLAGGNTTLIVEGVPHLRRIGYDNLSNSTVTNGLELVIESAKVYYGEPLKKAFDYGVVIPLDVIKGVGVKVRS